MALPISLKTVDSKHLDLFSAELSLSEARPLYFCDTDGDRAGVLWYLRRITVDKVDPQDASREAREMGLRDKEFWLAASTYLESLKPANAGAGPRRPPSESPPRTSPARPSPRTSPPRRRSSRRWTCSMRRSSRRWSFPRPRSVVPEESDGSLRDTAAWRPLAALMITGLGAPLAYWGRSGFPIRSPRQGQSAGSGASTEIASGRVG